MTWTKISKPASTTWNPINTMGKEQYDQSDATYDSATTYYDSTNPNQWTNIAKPTGNRVLLPGMATGLIMPPTYTREHSFDKWVRVSKPTT